MSADLVVVLSKNLSYFGILAKVLENFLGTIFTFSSY